MAVTELSFTVSATAMIPERAFPAANKRGVLPSPESFSIAFSCSGVRAIPFSLRKAAFPAKHLFPSQLPITPFPKTAWNSRTPGMGTPFAAASFTTASASGCSLGFSMAAA